jgi:hypothetical protein
MVKEICKYLADNLSLTIGTDLYCGWREDNAPDACDVVLESGGTPNFYLVDKKEYTIQVISRDATYQTARTRAYNIFNFLHGKQGISINSIDNLGVKYIMNVIEALNIPQSIGQDSPSGRWEFSTNYIIRYALE